MHESIGSSPRVRGTVALVSCDAFACRFIPARAGNGGLGVVRCLRVSVHPRACGERYSEYAPLATTSGSSPRVRGTGRIGAAAHADKRFIPARAGNGPPPRETREQTSVHPRACGERGCVVEFGPRYHGSSPRVRGTGTQEHCLTSTTTGSSPRVRGTGGQDDPVVHMSHGSSPRVRGTGFKVRRDRGPSAVHPRACGERTIRARTSNICCRFIPARAGNGSINRSAHCGSTVHPRACGERRRQTGITRWPTGSSPRVRGTVPCWNASQPSLRFIPARAGNGCTTPGGSILTTVHPRACGERETFFVPPSVVIGSSPRVRGTVDSEGVAFVNLRFIPARAGNGQYKRVNGPFTHPVHPRACGERTRRYVIDNM